MTPLGLPKAETPEQVGFSSQRLQRLGDVIRADVDRRLIPGAVIEIARAGRVAYCEAFGFRDREGGADMHPNAIFRIASMHYRYLTRQLVYAALTKSRSRYAR